MIRACRETAGLRSPTEWWRTESRLLIGSTPEAVNDELTSQSLSHSLRYSVTQSVSWPVTHSPSLFLSFYSFRFSFLFFISPLLLSFAFLTAILHSPSSLDCVSGTSTLACRSSTGTVLGTGESTLAQSTSIQHRPPKIIRPTIGYD